MELMSGIQGIRLPERLDTLSVARLSEELVTALGSAAPVLGLTGATDQVFCLGLALDASHDGITETRAFADLLLALHRAGKPLMAVVDGQAIGGGLGLAAACDWVIATDRSTFALPELLWGLVPAIIWPVVADRMAPHVARHWTISAHTRGAAEALTTGLVDDVVAPDQLSGAVRRAQRMLGRLEPGALVRFRAWARESQGEALPRALTRGAEITAALLHSPPARERWATFAAGEAPWR